MSEEKKDTVAFVKALDDDPELRAKVGELKAKDYDGLIQVAAEAGYTFSVSALEHACLANRITHYCNELADVVGPYYYFRM